jgi:hypothetical protein
MATTIIVGASIRPLAQPSAIIVVQMDHLYDIKTHVRHPFFVVRFIELVAARTPYPKIAARLSQVVDNVTTQGAQFKCRVILYADVTGLGQPVVDLVKAKVESLVTVYMSGNEKRTEHESRVTMGKAWMVARLQTLFQSGYIHLPKTEATQLLVEEILAYSLDPAPQDNELTGSFTVGTQDELLTALGLACQGLPEREQAAEEYLDYMRRRVANPRPPLKTASKDWLKEWHGPSPVTSLDPLTREPGVAAPPTPGQEPGTRVP